MITKKLIAECLFMHTAESENPGSAIVTSPDTDAGVLCLLHYSTLNFIELWFHTTLKKRDGSFRCTSWQKNSQKK